MKKTDYKAPRQNVTFKLNIKIYTDFRNKCREKSTIPSRVIDKFMESYK